MQIDLVLDCWIFVDLRIDRTTVNQLNRNTLPHCHVLHVNFPRNGGYVLSILQLNLVPRLSCDWKKKDSIFCSIRFTIFVMRSEVKITRIWIPQKGSGKYILLQLLTLKPLVDFAEPHTNLLATYTVSHLSYGLTMSKTPDAKYSSSSVDLEHSILTVPALAKANYLKQHLVVYSLNMTFLFFNIKQFSIGCRK